MANKWISLDGKKDPPFNTPMLIAITVDNWEKGTLDKIEQTTKGKVYTFDIDAYDDGFNKQIGTHYMIIEPPQNNQ